MIGVTLRQLRYFCAVARQGHFGQAAAQCAISQPALSQQIRELESQLGALLVDRSGRRIAITPAGREVAARGEAILRAVEDMEAAVRAAGQSVSLRLGLIPTVAPYLLPRVLAMLAERGPEIELVPFEARTSRLIEGLHDGRLDGAVMALPAGDGAFHAEPLFSEEFLLARPLSAAGQPVPPAAALLDHGLLLLEEGHCLRDQALDYCGIAPRREGQRIEGSALSTLVQMVAAGLGITLIPQMAVATESRAARIDVIRLPAPRPGRQIGLVWRKSSPLAGQLQELATAIRGLSDETVEAAAATGR